MNVPFQITIAAARANVGMTQQEMAEALNVDRVTYNHFEQGKAIMRMVMAMLFAEITHVPLAYINFCLPKSTT